MAFTARLQSEVEEAAKLYAKGLGISLNALLSVALRDYLHARQAMPGSGASSRPSSAPAAPAPASLPPPVARWTKPPQGNRRAPCQCGSGLRWKDCHGKAA